MTGAPPRDLFPDSRQKFPVVRGVDRERWQIHSPLTVMMGQSPGCASTSASPESTRLAGRSSPWYRTVMDVIRRGSLSLAVPNAATACFTVMK